MPGFAVRGSQLAVRSPAARQEPQENGRRGVQLLWATGSTRGWGRAGRWFTVKSGLLPFSRSPVCPWHAAGRRTYTRGSKFAVRGSRSRFDTWAPWLAVRFRNQKSQCHRGRRCACGNLLERGLRRVALDPLVGGDRVLPEVFLGDRSRLRRRSTPSRPRRPCRRAPRRRCSASRCRRGCGPRRRPPISVSSPARYVCKSVETFPSTRWMICGQLDVDLRTLAELAQDGVERRSIRGPLERYQRRQMIEDDAQIRHLVGRAHHGLQQRQARIRRVHDEVGLREQLEPVDEIRDSTCVVMSRPHRFP